MQASARAGEGDAEIAADVSHYRAILRQRTRYYLAQRDAGVSPLGAAILDLVILGNLEGCSMDVESLAGVMEITRTIARERVVELIRDGWIEVRTSGTGARLYATEKTAAFAERWIAIASAA